MRKPSLEPTPLGEDEGVVFFDSATGDVHILDGVAADILMCFEKEQDVEKTIDMLTDMYDEGRSTIESDVKEFIELLVDKGLLVVGENENENR